METGYSLGQLELFHSRYNKASEDECWEWNACTTDGYGQLSFNGENIRAHRLSYILNVGPIPKGLLICHKCDNRKCVNPKHLFLGTHSDNTLDMFRKGRGKTLKGEKSNLAKLMDKEVREVKDLSLCGLFSQSLIAKWYGVSQVTVSQIKTGFSRS